MCRHNDFESITMPAMPFAASQVLILPGLGGPQSAHWTVQWPQLHGHTLVDQQDWHSPLRGDWLMGLEEAVLARSGPLVLAADGLACLMVAAWASISRQAQRPMAVAATCPSASLTTTSPWHARENDSSRLDRLRQARAAYGRASNRSRPPGAGIRCRCAVASRAGFARRAARFIHCRSLRTG